MSISHVGAACRLASILLGISWIGLRAQAQNLVQNSGFEQGLSHWSSAACALDTTQRHWEEKCVRLGDQGQLAQTISGLTAGQTYYVNLWCKGKDAGAKGLLTAGILGQYRAALPVGTYGWTRVQMRFVANAPRLPIAIRMQGKPGTFWVGEVYVTHNPCVNVRSLGIFGDGKTDVTQALSAALAAKRFLYLPAGTYSVSDSLTVPKSAILWGDGAATILRKQNPRMGAFLTASGTNAEYVGGNEVTGIRFVGLPGQGENIEQHALRFVKVNGLLVRRCSTRDCGLLLTETNKKTYGEVTSEADLSKKVRVAFNDIEGSPEHPSPSTGIELRYTTDAIAYRNTVHGFAHGIMWWGGDSNFSVNGAMTNPRWSRRIVIAGNTVSHVGGGGIWGSMGQNVTIKNNSVKTCGDVGVDLEGCFKSVADSNTVADAHNGGLSSFFGTSNVTFSRNSVTTSRPEWPLFRLYNSSVDPKNVRNVVLRGNQFRSISGVGIVDDHNGPGQLTFIGNTFTNVCLDITHRGTGMNVAGPTITDNTLTFTTDVPAAFTAVNVLYLFGDTTVSRNTIRYRGAAQANKTGIQVQKEPGERGKLTIAENTIIGFGQADIRVAGKALGSAAAIDRNVVGHRVISVSDSSVLKVSGSGNKDLTGAAVALTETP